MSYLLDTNVVSEVIRQQPNPQVLTWLAQIPNQQLYISVLTLGEIRKGVYAAADQKRRERLCDWLDVQLPQWFGARILPVDEAVAHRWGFLWAEMARPLPVIDSLLAATALQHQLCIATRNTRDFNYPQLRLINPWDGLPTEGLPTEC